jgi:hypothetical protein
LPAVTLFAGPAHGEVQRVLLLLLTGVLRLRALSSSARSASMAFAMLSCSGKRWLNDRFRH